VNRLLFRFALAIVLAAPAFGSSASIGLAPSGKEGVSVYRPSEEDVSKSRPAEKDIPPRSKPLPYPKSKPLPPPQVEDEADVVQEAPDAPLGLRLIFDYLRRESAAERADFSRVALAYESESAFLNPRCGIEFRVEDTRLRSYWFGNDIRIDKWAGASLRFNHTEYADWLASINQLSAYYTYSRWHFNFGIGVGYSSLNFDPENYQSPFDFSSEAPETRLIYKVDWRPPLWEEVLYLDFGFNNYDDFEYHGFDDNGYHVGAIIHISENAVLRGYYERRYAAAFISVPTLSRTTWVVTFELLF